MLARTPRSKGSRALVIGATQAAFWSVLCAALVVASFSVGKAFTKYGMKLPDTTQAVFDFALCLCRFWYLGLLVAGCWPLVNWGVVKLFSRDPEAFILRRLWYLATWIVPIVAAIFALAALAIPLMALHRHIS